MSVGCGSVSQWRMKRWKLLPAWPDITHEKWWVLILQYLLLMKSYLLVLFCSWAKTALQTVPVNIRVWYKCSYCSILSLQQTLVIQELWIHGLWTLMLVIIAGLLPFCRHTMWMRASTHGWSSASFVICMGLICTDALFFINHNFKLISHLHLH